MSNDPFAPGVGAHDAPAVFEAEYVNVKMVRDVVQVWFEAPKEHRHKIMEVLGGLPPGDGSVRVAIARLTTDWP